MAVVGDSDGGVGPTRIVELPHPASATQVSATAVAARTRPDPLGAMSASCLGRTRNTEDDPTWIHRARWDEMTSRFA